MLRSRRRAVNPHDDAGAARGGLSRGFTARGSRGTRVGKSVVVYVVVAVLLSAAIVFKLLGN